LIEVPLPPCAEAVFFAGFIVQGADLLDPAAKRFIILPLYGLRHDEPG
jgi:hypothetical protein